ncbi:MAG TPA: hypothetical protein VK923_17340 [Euzebyales bacterium]|nr:hypothetical protein [Euzebyales bacterium]
MGAQPDPQRADARPAVALAVGDLDLVCSRLAQLPGHDGVGVYAIIGDGTIIPLALRGNDAPWILIGGDILARSDWIDDYPRVRQAVDALGSTVRLLSVDDAGSGYAGLTRVLALRPPFTKLGRRWVDGIATDPVRRALVAGLQHFAWRTGVPA